MSNSKNQKRDEDKLRRTAICPKCFRVMPLEGHHIFPVRFFGRKNNKRNRLFLCHDCHTEVERMLPVTTKLTRTAYMVFHTKWMRGKEPRLYLP